MVVPADDVRSQLARILMAQQGQSAPRSTAGPVRPGGVPGGPAASKAAVQLSRGASRAIAANPTLKERIGQIAAGEKAAPTGLMGTVLGNPLVKGALKGAELFALPGRAVTATIGEIVDALDEDPTTKGSFSDWGKRMKDPTTGFGKAARVNTGSKWLDRVIGFVGDVALDPVTYMTFGAGKFAGYAGRVRLAGEVLQNTGDNALAAAVAREGRKALRGRSDVLERVGANNFGVYMFGKRVKVGPDGRGWKVPLSGHIGYLGESTLSKIRLGITDTRVGKYLQKMTLPKNMLEARIAVAQGAGSAENLADYIRFFNMEPAQRAARGAALQAFEAELLALIKQEEALGDVEAYRKTIYRFLENPDTISTATPAEQRALAIWQNYFNMHKQRIEEGFRAIDPAAEIGMRQNYFPRSLTDEALAYVRADTNHGQALREIFMEDPFAKPDAFTPRSLRPGKKFFGKVLEEEDMYVERLNDIARRGGFEGDFFETDIIEAAKKYIQDAADEMGIIERNKILRQTGFFKELEAMRIQQLELDEEAIAAARVRVQEIDNVLEGVAENYKNATVNLVDEMRIGANAVDSRIVSTEEMLAKLDNHLYDAKENMMRLERAIEDAKARLVSMFDDPANVDPTTLSPRFPETLLPVLKNFDSINQEIAIYKAALDDARNTVLVGNVELINTKAMADNLEMVARDAAAAFEEAVDSIRQGMELSNVLQATWDRVTEGGRVGGSSEAHKVMVEIRTALDLQPGVSAKQRANQQRQLLGTTGALKDFVDSAEFKVIFSAFSGDPKAAPIVIKTIKNMTAKNFENILNMALTDEVTVRSLREASMYALARDMHAHNVKRIEDLPEAVQASWGRLAQKLEDAAEFDKFKYIETRGTKNWTKVETAAAKLQPVYDQAIWVRREIDDNRFAVRFLDGLSDDAIFDEEIVEAIEASLRDSGVNRIQAHLYDIIDNERGDIFTVGQVKEMLGVRASALDTSFDTTFVDVGLDGRWTNLKQFDTDTTVKMNYRQVVDEYERLVAERTKGVKIGDRVRNRIFENGDKLKDELAFELIQHTAISDAVAKFTAVSAILAKNGMVPTEDMWRGILRSTYNRYGTQFEQRFSMIDSMENAVSDMYRVYLSEMENAKRLAVATGEQPVPSVVFAQVLESFLGGEQGDALRMAIGPSMANMVDPYDLNLRRRQLEGALRRAQGDSPEAVAAAKLALDNFYRDYLIPWAKSFDPSIRAQKGPAKAVLESVVPRNAARGRKTTQVPGKTQVRAAQKTVEVYGSPLSADATEKQVLAWFDNFFDSRQDAATYTATRGADVLPVLDITTNEYVFPGTFTSMRTTLAPARAMFDNMRDGFIDPYMFLNNPTMIQDTPSSWSAMMSRLARELTGSSDIAGDVSVPGLAARRAEARVAAREAQRPVAKAEERAARAERVAEAFKDENLTLDDLKELGFTKSMREARDGVIEYNEFISSPGYAKALQDKEIIDFLDATAHLDFGKFTDGIVLGYNRREALESAAGLDEAMRIEVRALQDEIRKIDEEQTQAVQTVLKEFKTPTGRWIDRSSSRKAKRAVEEWNRGAGATYKQRLEEAQAKLQEISARAGLAPQGFDEIPIFATMPDGTKLVFNPTEWESLYRPTLAAGEVAALRREQKALVKTIENARKQKRRLQTSPQDYTAGRLAYEMREIEEILVSAPARIAEIDRLVAVGSKEVQNAALEKLRILLFGHAGNGWRGTSKESWMDTWVNLSEISMRSSKTRKKWVPHRESLYVNDNPTITYYKGNKNVDVQDIAARTEAGSRRETLMVAWERNKSSQILVQAQEMASSAAVKTSRSKATEARNLRRAAREAQRVADEARLELTDVQRNLRQRVVDMRMAEIKAAKAAGAEFDTMARTYTLNGRTYELPTFQEMMRNPEKFARRAEKQAQLFWDLRKPGAPAVWADMDEQTRAIAGLWALHGNYVRAERAAKTYKMAVQDEGLRIKEINRLMQSWTKDLKVLQKNIDAVNRAMKVEQNLVAKEIEDLSRQGVEARLDFWDFSEELRSLYGDLADSPDLLPHLQTTLNSLKVRKEMFEQILANAPTRQQGRSLRTAVRDSTVDRLLTVHEEWISRHLTEMRALATADLSDAGESALYDALMRASAAEARFIREQARLGQAQAELARLSEGTMVEKVIMPFEEGYERAAKTYLEERNLKTAGDLMMPSYGVNPDVQKMLSNLARVKDGAVARDLGRMVGQYTGFFKAYATLSPGFHVRNAISNIAQMFAAGAEVKNMRRGLKIYTSFGNHLKDGGTLESWMRSPEFLRLSEQERAAAKIAAEVNLALGSGNVEDAFREFVTLRRSIINDNVATRTSRRFGHRVEGSARFMLAFDSAINGEDYLGSFNRTKRFLFDYHDPTILDDTVRNIIPFWTWMSRNLPLQITNQWLNPKPYVIYQRFANNFGIGEDENVPQYMKDIGSYKIGADTYLSPDLPWSKTDEQIAEFGQPRRMLSYLNPAMRVPLELAGGRKFFNDQEFSDRYIPVKGVFKAFLPVLAATGQLEYDSEGNPVMSEKAMYAITSTVPTLGQAERLFPSSDFGDGAAALRYAGVPVRRVDEDARQRELEKRLRAIQALEQKQRRIEEAQ